MKDVYIFDLDGTLVDSMPIAVKIVLEYLDEYGIPCPDYIVKMFPPLGFRGVSEYYANELGVPKTSKEIYEDFQQRLLKAYEGVISLKENVKKTLLTLKEQGVRLNVLTASPHIFTDSCLKRCGVYGLFENVWSIDDFGLTKAQPQIYKEAAKRIGAAVTDCVMVDDNLEVLKIAKAVGMKTIGVYDESSKEYQAEMQSLADDYVVDFADILK